MTSSKLPYVGVLDDRKIPQDTEFIERYFTTGIIEYPDPTYTLLELGLWHTYLSSTFLNGWINYTKPLAARLVTRYQGHAANREAAEKMNAGEFGFHTDLGKLGDDVFLLCYSEIDPRKHVVPKDVVLRTYWLFWFDCDVSDCCIGRFQTETEEDQLVMEFEAWAEEMSQEYSRRYSGNEDCTENRDGKPSLMIETSMIKGWISF